MEKTFNEKRIELMAFITDNGSEELQAIAEELVKKAKKGSGVKQDSKQQLFRQALLEADDNKISEDEAWLKFRFGRHEALTACRNLHARVAEGEDAIFAQDVVEDGVTYYKILGIGEMPPEYQVRRKRAEVEIENPLAENFEDQVDEGLDIH